MIDFFEPCKRVSICRGGPKCPNGHKTKPGSIRGVEKKQWRGSPYRHYYCPECTKRKIEEEIKRNQKLLAELKEEK